MIELIPLCLMALADVSCPGVLRPHSMMKFDLPFRVCIVNETDTPGTFRFPSWTGERTMIVSQNLKLCDERVSVR